MILCRLCCQQCLPEPLHCFLSEAHQLSQSTQLGGNALPGASVSMTATIRHAYHTRSHLCSLLLIAMGLLAAECAELQGRAYHHKRLQIVGPWAAPALCIYPAQRICHIPCPPDSACPYMLHASFSRQRSTCVQLVSPDLADSVLNVCILLSHFIK